MKKYFQNIILKIHLKIVFNFLITLSQFYNLFGILNI